MSDDSLWSNSYSHAGKGTKARERLRSIEDVNARTMNTTRKKPKQRPYLPSPTNEKRRAKKIEHSESYHTAMGVKARLRYLVIDHDMSFLTMVETMRNEGCPVTEVSISNVRRDTLETIKLLEQEGLLNTDELARRRKRLKKGG